MEITLEKIELVKDRTGVSYGEAKEALEAAQGNVVDAIIAIEESINLSATAKVIDQSSQVVEIIKGYIRKGNVSRIVVSKDKEVVMNLSVNVGIVGTLLGPWAAIIGILFAFGLKYKIELVLDDGNVIDITEKAGDKLGDAVERGGLIVDAVKEKSAQVYDNVSDKVQDVVSKARYGAHVSSEDFKDTVDEMWEAAKKRVENVSDTVEGAEQPTPETP
jgi:hypothetical protein